MKINPLKLSVNRSLVAMALAVTSVLPVLGQSAQLPEGPHPSVAAEHRSAYFKDGEIHVNVLGQPEGKPLTTGHWDFKPSWSKTEDKLVFFRRVKNHPQVGMWKTAICIINADGTGFHQITDATQTNFNQTWTRDGKNTPIWNRKNPKGGGYHVMAGKIGGKPGEEIALTGKGTHTWAYTCLTDGRIVVNHAHAEQGRGYFLMTPKPKGQPVFEKIKCDLAKRRIPGSFELVGRPDQNLFRVPKGIQAKGSRSYLVPCRFRCQDPRHHQRQAFCQQGG